MGSPTIVADINSRRPDLAARGAPAGRRPAQRQRDARRPRPLPARDQLGRPRRARSSSSTRTAGSSTPGHIAKLELLPADQPYGRNSNGQAPVTVSNLELRLPVLEQPGALGGLVQEPAPKVVPPGYQLRRRLRLGGYPRPERRDAVPGSRSCPPSRSAPSPNRQHGAPLAFGSCNPPQQASEHAHGRDARRERPGRELDRARSSTASGDPTRRRGRDGRR